MRWSRKKDYSYLSGYFKVIFNQAFVKCNYGLWLYGRKSMVLKIKHR